ncbi:MAG: ABC transporter substrate-binding protein [Nitriliruptoraceae bacterium]
MTAARLGRRRLAPVGVALLLLTPLLGCEPQPTEPPTAPPLTTPEPDADSGPEPVAGGTLRVGLVVDPVTLDPRFIVDDEGEVIVDALFDPLIRLDERGRAQPGAAERWEVDEDGTSFRFELRPATFHDGTPVTAADVKRTFDRIADGTADPPSFLAYLLEDVVGIEEAQRDGEGLAGVVVEDERTLRIDLRRPHPSFLLTLADPSLVPTPPGADADVEAYGSEPIGNGPFAMAGPREPGSFIRIVRHEEHHAPPLLDEVLFTLYEPAAADTAQWNDLVDGQLQVAQLVPSRREEAIERFGVSVDGYRGPGVLDGIRSPVYLYGFDVTRPPFDDVRLRRAFALAIDRDRLAVEVTEGTRAPASSVVPPAIPGAQPGACDACVFDPDEARRLLDEVIADLVRADEPDEPADGSDDAALDADDGAGPPADPEGEAGAGGAEGEGPTDGGEGDEPPADEEDAAGEPSRDGDDAGGPEGVDGGTEDRVTLPPASEVLGPITLTYSQGVFHRAIADRMARDLSETLDLEVGVEAQELGAFIRGVRRGDTPVFRLGWDATEPDPASYLYPLFHSSQIGLDNLTRYVDDEVDALLEEARASADRTERRRLLRDAERRILADLPAVPILWYRHDVVIRPEVRDLSYSPLGRLSLARAWLVPSD